MPADEAARRYAQAAFQIAVDDGTIGAWRSDLQDIATVLTRSDLARVLADERVPAADRYAMLDRVLDIQPKALNLAKLLVSKGRSLGAVFVADAFARIADEYENRLQAQVTSAVQLTPAQVQRLAGQLSQSTGKNVTVSTQVDPSIMGGLVIRVADRLLDGSVRTRLRRLQRQLEGAF